MNGLHCFCDTYHYFHANMIHSGIIKFSGSRGSDLGKLELELDFHFLMLVKAGPLLKSNEFGKVCRDYDSVTLKR